MHGFIFISGILSSENSTKISNAIKLIILYYIFNFSFSLIVYFYIDAEISFLLPKYSYWYLLSLFYWRISIKYISNLKFIFAISIIISLLIGYWVSFNNVLSVVRTFGFFPYFLLGYKISKTGKFQSFLKWRKGLIKLIIFFVSFIFFLFLFISYINKNSIPNTALLMYNYTKYNTIEKRIIIMIISFIMILFFLLLTPNIKIPIINKWGRNSLYIYLFHRIFTVIADKKLFRKGKYSNHIIELSSSFTFIILFIFGSDFVTKNCNYILNSMHKNLVELNRKGKIIAFIFCFSFICLLLINPVTIYIDQVKIYKKTILKANNLLYSR
jgi:fucose 4-O-acetylase-like acetyltransferase